MRKFVLSFITISIIVIFIIIMHSAAFLKKPLGKDDDVSLYINNVIENVQKEQWKEAKESTEKLQIAWTKVDKRVQFSAERDEILALYVGIARVKGAIDAMDKSAALIELNEIIEHWKEIGR